ncbi:MAG: carbon starvation protein A [Anaerolineae bacterium]|jgi:carbon starvation protein|nr:carbon starvation protein A [Anaerolineae bacterium]MDH7474545.1 carbon starvation CstA family protein [Anaerolineae bacterium]
MFTILVLILAAAGVAIGYGLYARTIDKNIIQPDPKKATPAKMYMDGVDFTPASKNVLFGYQFKSIAALGPITGPIIAVQWGWLPAIVWIILGTFFIGWVQDYGSMMMGVRRDGDTMGALSYKLISPRARNILMLFLYFYLLLIMGAFGIAVGKTLMTNTKVPFGMISVVLMGILAGQMTYKWKRDIILTTIVTVVLTFVGIWLSTQPFMANIFSALYGFHKVEDKVVSPTWFLGNTQAQVIGTLLVVIFCYLGSVLPIWSFAQPVNYVSFWIVSFGVLGGILGMLIWRPGIGDFPAFTTFTTASGPLWPMLFVTIACGAVSGWHSLVSTSGTARQLEKETDALPVGGGAMFLEMVFATVAFMTATVAWGSFKGYQDAGGAAAALAVFSKGLANFLSHIGVPQDFGTAYGSVFLTIMALTIMQLAVRFMRVASAELLGDAVPAMKNVHVGTIVALLLTLLFVWVIPWLTIWAAFGAANQLMAGLALMLVSLWLMSEGRKNAWTLYPSIFMIVTTIAALLFLAYTNFKKLATPNITTQAFLASLLVGIIALVLVVAAAVLIADGWKALRKPRAKEAVEKV